MNETEPPLNNENTTHNESSQSDSTRAQDNTLTERQFDYMGESLGDGFSDSNEEKKESIATKTIATETKETATIATKIMETETIATPPAPPPQSSSITTSTSNNNNITSSYSAYNSNNDTPSN